MGRISFNIEEVRKFCSENNLVLKELRIITGFSLAEARDMIEHGGTLKTNLAEVEASVLLTKLLRAGAEAHVE